MTVLVGAIVSSTAIEYYKSRDSIDIRGYKGYAVGEDKDRNREIVWEEGNLFYSIATGDSGITRDKLKAIVEELVY